MKKIDVNGLNNNVKLITDSFCSNYNNPWEGELKLTPTIDSIMKANKQRFAMASDNSWQLEEGNYETKLRRNWVGILTLGMYAPVPIKQVFSLVYNYFRF
jgi:hypothetical protein